MALEQIMAHASPNEIDFGLSVNIDRNCAGCRLTFEIPDLPFNVSALSALGLTALEDVAPPIQTLPRGKAAVVFPRL
jgi:hypothetical protein